jgi:hypothetical protein
MAAYPSYTIGLESRVDPVKRYQDDFDSSGAQHSRLFHDKQYYEFSLLHPGMTKAQVTALEATYDAAPRDVHTLTYRDESPAATYSVKFTERPRIVNNHGGGKYDVRVELYGYRD